MKYTKFLAMLLILMFVAGFCFAEEIEEAMPAEIPDAPETVESEITETVPVIETKSYGYADGVLTVEGTHGYEVGKVYWTEDGTVYVTISVFYPDEYNPASEDGYGYGYTDTYRVCAAADVRKVIVEQSCNSLSSLYLPNARELIIPDNATSIPFDACKDWMSLSRVTGGAAIEEIGNNAFRNCGSLGSFTLPSGLKTIGRDAFAESGIGSVTIPASVERIDYGAFNDCGSLMDVTFEGAPANMANALFSGCTLLNSVRGLPATKEGMFIGCSSLREVEFANGVTRISTSAFAGCGALESVTFPDTLESIGPYAFENCFRLKNVTIPASVTRIEERAFQKCTSIGEIVIPRTVTAVGPYIFAGTNTVVRCDPDTAYARNYENWECITHRARTVLPAKSATYFTEGKTEGSKCADCRKIFTAQQTIPRLTELKLRTGGTYTFTPPSGRNFAFVSDAAKIAKVSANGKVTAVKAGTCTISLIEAHGDIFKVKVTVEKSATKITLPKSKTVRVGESYTPSLKANGVTGTITWTTSKATVATVRDGVITAVGQGTATITAKSGKLKASVKITVPDPYIPAGVALQPSGTVNMQMGTPVTLTPVLTPANAKASYSWKTSNKKIAKVAGGVVTPVAEGTAKITVTATRGKTKKTATVTVKVTDPFKPTGLSLNHTGTYAMIKGETEQMTAAPAPANALGTITWKTSNKKVATVSGNGLVTAKGKGTATITATITRGKTKKTASVKVSVRTR